MSTDPLCFDKPLSQMTATEIAAHRKAGTTTFCQRLARPSRVNPRKFIYSDVVEFSEEILAVSVARSLARDPMMSKSGGVIKRVKKNRPEKPAKTWLREFISTDCLTVEP